MVLDVTVVDPQAPANVTEGMKMSGRVAERAAQGKYTKYAGRILDTATLIPLAIETFGHMDTPFHQLLRDVALVRARANQAQDVTALVQENASAVHPHVAGYLASYLRRVSVTLQRALSLSERKHMPVASRQKWGRGRGNARRKGGDSSWEDGWSGEVTAPPWEWRRGERGS